MFWQEDDKPQGFKVSDDIVDLVFDIQCRELPVDHAHELSVALEALLPGLQQDQRLGAARPQAWSETDPVAPHQADAASPKGTPATGAGRSRRSRIGHRRLRTQDWQGQAESVV